LKRRHNGVLVVGVLLVLATAIGVLAYWRFTVSEGYLRLDLDQVYADGSRLSVEQCVDETLRWGGHCKAMKSLCDASAPRIMHACLMARDRRATCEELGDSIRDTHFGFKECKARGVTRKNKKTCASAYRAIAGHCTHLAENRGKGSQP
jgi:hypothetical protein